MERKAKAYFFCLSFSLHLPLSKSPLFFLRAWEKEREEDGMERERGRENIEKEGRREKAPSQQ